MNRPRFAPMLLHAALCGALALCLGCASSSAKQAPQEGDEMLEGLKMPRIRVNLAKRQAERPKDEHARFWVIEGDGRFYFSLGVDGEVLLRSPEGYATEHAAKEVMEEVASLIKSTRAMPFQRLDSGEHYFVVRARGDVLATSSLCATAAEARLLRARVKRLEIDRREEGALGELGG